MVLTWETWQGKVVLTCETWQGKVVLTCETYVSGQRHMIYITFGVLKEGGGVGWLLHSPFMARKTTVL